MLSRRYRKRDWDKNMRKDMDRYCFLNGNGYNICKINKLSNFKTCNYERLFYEWWWLFDVWELWRKSPSVGSSCGWEAKKKKRKCSRVDRGDSDLWRFLSLYIHICNCIRRSHFLGLVCICDLHLSYCSVYLWLHKSHQGISWLYGVILAF